MAICIRQRNFFMLINKYKFIYFLYNVGHVSLIIIYKNSFIAQFYSREYNS